MVTNPFFWARYLYLFIQSNLEDLIGERPSSVISFIISVSASVLVLYLFLSGTTALAEWMAGLIRG